ncbi:hypothetical protein DFH29DRAFT_1002368 [Suillus ampliporus]|nr:hypothetical protein DFH29DRAFT_1002368 [Suillus ampliporus]
MPGHNVVYLYAQQCTLQCGIHTLVQEAANKFAFLRRHMSHSLTAADVIDNIGQDWRLNHHEIEIANLEMYSKCLYREVSNIFLKHKVDAQLEPFSIKRVELYEPCNTTAFIWSLPAEILILIVAFLGAQDMHYVAHVCSLLREIAGLLFSANQNFPTSPQDLCHIHVDSPNFDVLPTWIQMDTFHPPRMMLCWLDSDLRAPQLSAFSHFLQSVPHKSIRYVTLFWNFNILASPILPQIITFLENICASGCEELMCMGFCHLGRVGVNHLKAFEVSLGMLFSPKLLPFTIQTICCSHLEKLRLTSIKLSSAHWDKLLRYLVIPTLIKLQVDADCAPSTLIRFWPATLLLMTSVSFRDLVMDLCPMSSQSFGVSVNRPPSAALYFHCKLMTHRLTTLPPFYNSHSLSAMIWPGTHSAVRINHLAIDSSDAAGSSSAPAGDALALSAVWIEAFPEVKRVSIIAAADVEVSVKLQSPERSL